MNSMLLHSQLQIAKFKTIINSLIQNLKVLESRGILYSATYCSGYNTDLFFLIEIFLIPERSSEVCRKYNSYIKILS